MDIYLDQCALVKIQQFNTQHTTFTLQVTTTKKIMFED